MTEESTNTEVVTDQVTETTANETKPFDPKAFITPESEKKQTGTEDKTGSETTSTAAADTAGNEETDELGKEFSWDFGDQPKAETQTQTNTEPTAETADTTQNQPTIDYVSVGKQLGLEVKDEADFKAKWEEKNKEIETLRQQTVNSVTTPEIEAVSVALKWDDEKLVRHDWKRQGLDEETINDAIDKLKDNGLLKIEAGKVRAVINNYITGERQKKVNADNATKAQNQKAQQDNLKNIREHLNKTNELFGFKIAEPDKIQKRRDEHFDYLASGKFWDEIFASPESVIQASFLWRNRENMLKAMTNRAKSQGRQEVLNKIQNTTVTDTGRINLPVEKDEEFNPKKFMHGVEAGG